MKRAALLAAALALASCERDVDPLAEQRAACADAERAPQERRDACSALLEAAELDTAQRADTQARRGAAHRAAGDVTAALRDFEAALHVNGDQPDALEGRAAILLASGQLDAAEPLVDRLIASGRGASIPSASGTSHTRSTFRNCGADASPCVSGGSSSVTPTTSGSSSAA